MKKILLCCYIIISLIYGTKAQNQVIKSTLVFSVDEKGNSQLVKTINNNQRGLTTRTIELNAIGLKDTTFYIYNVDNQLLQINFPRNRKTGTINTINKLYDNKGYLIEEYYRDNTDSTKSYTIKYFNNESGFPLEAVTYYTKVRIRKNFQYDSLNKIKEEQYAQSIYEPEYNDWGPYEYQKKDKYFYNEKGQLYTKEQQSWQFEYINEKRKMITKVVYQTVYYFNEKGQIIEEETKELLPSIGYKRTMTTFDELGKEKKKSIYKFNRNSEKNPIIETIEFKYEFF
ncbi:MAG: hypothetical protein IPN93_12125 [Bacteroidetes bacterium]|nr:hypothetical protein [Bacteroidota bacterium]MBK8673679.1 hypothetical protein [Bacteroidota bacterium]MBL0286320.1 hypothetical protein [Bacteroidota bacterium]MBP7255765.1 hypothetical protein [Chitinophagales bacterium]